MSMKSANSVVADLALLSEDGLHHGLEKGYEDSQKGRVKPDKKVF